MPNQGLEAEEKVKLVLEKEFGKSFSRRTILIGKKRKRFDLVSDDGQIIVEVKSSKLGNETTGKSGYSSTRNPRLIKDCFYLEKVKAKKKILALTDKELFNQFKNDMDGLLNSEIEIRYIPIIQDQNKIAAKPLNKKEDTIVEKTHNDKAKYSFDGKEYAHRKKDAGKNRLVLAVVRKYLHDNPHTSYEELLNVFPKKLQGSRGIVLKLSEIRDKTRYFEELLETGDGVKVAVCNQWGNLDEKYDTDRQDIDNFIDHVKEALKYEIKKI